MFLIKICSTKLLQLSNYDEILLEIKTTWKIMTTNASTIIIIINYIWQKADNFTNLSAVEGSRSIVTQGVHRYNVISCH